MITDRLLQQASGRRIGRKARPTAKAKRGAYKAAIIASDEAWRAVPGGGWVKRRFELHATKGWRDYSAGPVIRAARPPWLAGGQ